MADKIQRQTQKIFAENAATDSLAVFGSMVTGNPIYTDNIEDLQSNAYQEGWASATAANEAPFMEEMNGVQYGLSKQIAYTLQTGMPEWDAGTEYFANTSFCQVDGVWYQSLTDHNIGNNPTEDTTNWKEVDFSGTEPSTGTSLPLFTPVVQDRILSFEESKGYALQGTYVYKDSAPERYGYPDFYNRCVEEYQDTSNTLIPKVTKTNVDFAGDLSNDNGLISNFTASNYAIIPQNWSFLSPWEFHTKFTTNDNSTTQVILGNSRASSNSALYLGITSSNLVLSLSSNGTSYNITQSTTGGTVIQSNQDYYIRLSWDGTTYKVELSTDNDNWTTEVSVDSTLAVYAITELFTLGRYGNVTANYLRGGIDLKETYININGQRWWNAANVVNIIKNTNGHLFYNVSEKSAIDKLFEENGIAWMYGMDTENERIFLPRDAKRVLVERKLPDSSGSWYNIYSDGWCEQGGFVNSGWSTNRANITFLKEFKNTDYNVLANTKTMTYQYGTISIVNYSTKGCTFAGAQGGGGSTFDFNWKACGYIDKKVDIPLYIVVGNSEEEKAITNVTEITTSENDTIPLFTGMYFDFKPNNASWLKAGEQANNGGIYTSCYNTLVSCLTEANNIYDLKVIATSDMEADIDYSEYWKVNQDEMYFITPTKLSYKAIEENAAVITSSVANINNDKITNNLTWKNLDANAPATGTSQHLYVQTGKTRSANYGTNAWSNEYALAPDNLVLDTDNSTAQLYFKVANAVQNLELLDAGEVLESLADKIGRQDCKAYVTETYQNGTSWYRIWSDGWCEQGGRIRGSANGSTLVTMLKAYRDTDYSIQCASYLESSPSGTAYTVQNSSAWAVGVDRFYVYAFTAIEKTWEAKGYIN